MFFSSLDPLGINKGKKMEDCLEEKYLWVEGWSAQPCSHLSTGERWNA